MPNISSASTFADLNLPPQDLPKLGFCTGSKLSHVQHWVNHLPATRITHTGVQLYKNLPEINRLQTDAKTRLDMLEALRPSVQSSIAGLASQFLGQPAILPKELQKTAIVAQALQKALINGYSICARDLSGQKNLNNQGRDNLAKSLCRAIAGIGLLYLRSCQIYTQLPAGLWLHLHHLYRLAEDQGLAAALVPDSLIEGRQSSSSQAEYLRIIMLACANPNQLSQQDLGVTFHAFADWSYLVRLGPLSERDTFAVNPFTDKPPMDRERCVENEPALGVDFSRLITALERQKTQPQGTSDALHMPREMPPSLVNHLLHNWAESVDRQQHRRKVKTLVDVCIGLSASHYQLADGKDFMAFIGETGDESWAELPGLPTLAGFTPRDRAAKPDTENPHAPTRVTVQDVSAGGYCLLWQGKIPIQATAGQLLAIRDVGQSEWHLGVIRWIRQLRDASQMGVQVVALNAKPAGAAIIYDMGGYSDVMRVLQVAPDEYGATAATLITAAAPFQESGRIQLVSGGRRLTAKLDECIFSTSSLRQFKYHLLSSDAESTARPPSGSSSKNADFDSNWD